MRCAPRALASVKTGKPTAREFQRALERGNVWVADAVARELPRPLSLEDALKLTHLYAEKESPKYEAAAMKWLRRYLEESRPRSRTSRSGREPPEAAALGGLGEIAVSGAWRVPVSP
jgi:hypothetical protein